MWYLDGDVVDDSTDRYSWIMQKAVFLVLAWQLSPLTAVCLSDGLAVSDHIDRWRASCMREHFPFSARAKRQQKVTDNSIAF